MGTACQSGRSLLQSHKSKKARVMREDGVCSTHCPCLSGDAVGNNSSYPNVRVKSCA